MNSVDEGRRNANHVLKGVSWQTSFRLLAVNVLPSQIRTSKKAGLQKEVTARNKRPAEKAKLRDDSLGFLSP